MNRQFPQRWKYSIAANKIDGWKCWEIDENGVARIFANGCIFFNPDFVLDGHRERYGTTIFRPVLPFHLVAADKLLLYVGSFIYNMLIMEYSMKECESE